MIGLWALRTTVARGKEWVLCNKYKEEDAEEWLKIWQKDEPTTKFVLSDKKPKLKEKTAITLQEGQKVLDEDGNIYEIEKGDVLQENFNEIYLDMIKELSDKDYDLKGTYYRLDEVTEIIRIDQGLSLRDKIETITVKGQKDVYFTASKEILPNYKMKVEGKDPKFHLYEMTYSTYNRLGF